MEGMGHVVGRAVMRIGLADHDAPLDAGDTRARLGPLNREDQLVVTGLGGQFRPLAVGTGAPPDWKTCRSPGGAAR